MQKYIRRTLCIYAAVLPLAVSSTEVHVPPSAPPPPQDPHWHAAAAAAANYPHPHQQHHHHHHQQHHHQPPPPPAAAATYPSGAIPAAHPHASHGYMNHHDPAVPPPPPPPPNNTAVKDTSTDHHNPGNKHYQLWEQSTGAYELTHHSWQPPLAQEHLSHWDVAMSTVPSGDHVLLLPGDANRTGQFWHRNAIPSSHFEVQFGFGVYGKDQGINEAAGGVSNGVGIPEGFAFWYVYEPYAHVYPRSAEEQASWNLIGYKSNPKGLGVVFKALDKEGHINPSVSCIHNTEDGRALADEIPSSSALFYQYRNQSSPVLFRVIVDSQGVVAQIREAVTSAWVTACSLEHVILRPHGFIGFTAYNRPAEGQHAAAQEQHQQQQQQQQQQQGAAHTSSGDQVLLYFVKAWSLDPLPPQHAQQGQQAAPHPPSATHHAYDQHLHADPQHTQHLHAEHYDAHAAAAHAYPYIDPHYTHAEQSIMRMLQSVGNQLSMLSVEVSNLQHDVRRLWGEEGSDAVKSIQSELTGFKDLFKRHSQQHTSALHTIHKHVESRAGVTKDGHAPLLSQLTDLSSQLERGIAMKHSHSFILSAAALVLVVLCAICSWRKFQDIEKKHML